MAKEYDYSDKNKNLKEAKSEDEYNAMQIEGDKQIVRGRQKALGNKLEKDDYYMSATKGLPRHKEYR